MLEVYFTPTFLRMYAKIPVLLQEEVKEKIERFKTKDNHKGLKVHKLKNREGIYSFSVNYKIRILFEYQTDKSCVNFLVLGDHDDVY